MAADAKPAAGKTDLAPGLIYCHPDDPTLTWTGKGKQPDWVTALYATGGGLDVREKGEAMPAAAAPAEPPPAPALSNRPAWPFPGKTA